MRLGKHVIALSVLLALLLQIMPMPMQVSYFRPDWVLLVLAYWAMALPARVSVGIAMLNGILLDILLGTALGVHSFALSAAIYVIAANYQRLRNYSVWQQAIMIGLLAALYRITIFWLQYLMTDIYFLFVYLLPVVSAVFIWPWLFALLRKLRRQTGLN